MQFHVVCAGRQDQFPSGRLAGLADNNCLDEDGRFTVSMTEPGEFKHRDTLLRGYPKPAVVGDGHVPKPAAALRGVHPVRAVEESVLRRRVSFVLPLLKAVRHGPVDAVSAKPQIFPGLGHPCNPGGAIEPDDPIFLNVERCPGGPKCKEVSKSILSKPKS